MAVFLLDILNCDFVKSIKRDKCVDDVHTVMAEYSEFYRLLFLILYIV